MNRRESSGKVADRAKCGSVCGSSFTRSRQSCRLYRLVEKLIMSVDALVQAEVDLKASIDAAVAKLGQPPAEDPRIQEVTDKLVADKAALDAAVNPPA